MNIYFSFSLPFSLSFRWWTVRINFRKSCQTNRRRKKKFEFICSENKFEWIGIYYESSSSSLYACNQCHQFYHFSFFLFVQAKRYQPINTIKQIIIMDKWTKPFEHKIQTKTSPRIYQYTHTNNNKYGRNVFFLLWLNQ